MSGEVQTGGVRTTQASWVRRWSRTSPEADAAGRRSRRPWREETLSVWRPQASWPGVSMRGGVVSPSGPQTRARARRGPRAGPSAPGSHPSPAPVWAAGRREQGRAAQVSPGCPRGSRAPAAPRACPAASRGARAALVCLHDNEQATDCSMSLTCPWVVRRVLRLGRGTPKSLVRICLDDIFRFRAAAGAIRKCWRSSRPLVSPFTPAASLHPGAG